MIIKDTPGFQLRATVTPSAGGNFSLDLAQHWPQAQRPEWRRIAQLNLSGAELDTLANLLKDRNHDHPATS